jgi:two-component system sensor histidine kinase/response regulator
MSKNVQRAPDVLVIDDDDKFRTFVHDALVVEGLIVHQGRTGKEALAAFNKNSYDLLLLDYKLPDMNGIDVLKSVREKSPATDVMVITGYKDIDLAVDLLKLGAKEYVTKPIDPEELVQRVRTAVRAHTAEQRLKQIQFDFSSRLFYDLRTPLQTIMSTLEYLKKDTTGKLSERQHLLLENLKTSLHQMGGLLNDMIDLNILESGKVEIEKLPTNLDEVLPGIIERFRAQANAKHLALTVKINGNIPTLEIDANKIDQVFSNLLDNAIKYTNSGEIKFTLSVTKALLNGSNHECVEVIIADTGIGISKEELPLVFDKYKDMLIGKSSTKRATGLGLAICRNIIDTHNGSISVDSTIGKGSTFKILLPVDAA